MDGSGGSGSGDETDGDCQPVCQIGYAIAAAKVNDRILTPLALTF